MRILMVSMNSIHFQRWTNQLKDSGHEVFWFDINDGATVPSLSWLTAFQNWKHRWPKWRGRYFIKKKLPNLYKALERDTAKAFENVLLEVKPDVVHSFVLYLSCVPILKVMQRHSNLKWIYSSWGSDLYYFKDFPAYRKDIEAVLQRVNYLFTDCKRDVQLAKDMGFKGTVLGTFPGGGGYDFSVANTYIKTPVLERKIILIKGYQGRSGRAIEVLKALEQLNGELKKYQLVIFGADPEVLSYIEHHTFFKDLEVRVYSKSKMLSHQTILELMGRALLYIGNSASDGLPNTLLEAVICGAFPIQSNPGGASEDLITNEKNGLLIQDCCHIESITLQIKKALDTPNLIEQAFHFNQKTVKPQLEITIIKAKVLEAYRSVAY